MSDTPSLTKDNASGSLIAPVNKLAAQSSAKKAFLLVLFALSNFLDTFSISVLLLAVPVLSIDIGLGDSKAVWLIGSYELAFAAFLLVSGRMSDIYDPKYVFLSGITPLGLLAIGMGFVRNKIALLVLRALSGVAAALTIPSALNLLVHMYPDPASQSKAVGIYGTFMILGSVIGIQIGAVCVTFASWPWIFWIIAIIALSIGFICAWMIPSQDKHAVDAIKKTRSLDLVGVSTLTLTLILFVFAVTSGSTDGWGTATVLVPLILSLFLIVGFFTWEARIPVENAALPPRMWRYPNFTVLTLISLLPYTWWTTVFLLYSWLWQNVYGWSAVKCGVHFLPIGCFAFLMMFITGFIQQKVPNKLLLLLGLTLMLISCLLFPFADRPSRYWRFEFPGFLLGTAGATITFGISNISIFASTPPEVAGIVGAVFNSGLQLGTAVFTAAITSIQTSVEDTPMEYKGRAAGFWFLFALIAVEFLLALLFFKDLPAKKEQESTDDGVKSTSGSSGTMKELPA